MPDIAISQVMQFNSKAVDDGELMLSALTGEEAMNKPYEFHLELASPKSDIDFAEVIKKPAWIGIKQGVQVAGSNKRASTTLKIHGMVQSFEQVGKELELVKYRAVLVPKLKRLALAHQSRIFQDTNVPDMVKKICDDHGVEIDIDKLGSYDKREFIVQYEESDLDFIHRWLEHEGIYYYFVQEEENEKVVLADKPEGYGQLQSNESYAYRPRTSGKGRTESDDSEDATDDWFKEEVIDALACNVNLLPKEVVLNDYNWRDPETLLECTATVSDEGKGTVYAYNDHYQTKDQGKKLAQIRAEEINSREILFRGGSDVRGFRAGMVFELKEHFVQSFNQEYLLVEVRHHATQSVSLDHNQATGATYENSFLAIPKSKTFRPSTSTAWPSIKGVMHARIDGGDDGTPYAQIDDKGRYKVKFPLDRGDAQPGSASCWVRKAENYAGPGHGMHFPLLKGAEVLITFIDGDPDRPIVSASIFNEKNVTVVNNSNVVENRLRTPAGHEVILDDTQGAGGIKIFTTDQKNLIKMDATGGSEAISIKCSVTAATIRMGKSQGEPAGAKVTSADGVYIGTSGALNLFSSGADVNLESAANYNIQVGAIKNETIVSDYVLNVNGNEVKEVHGEKKDWTFGASTKGHVGMKNTIGVIDDNKLVGGIKFETIIGAEIKILAGLKSETIKAKKIDLIAAGWKAITPKKVSVQAVEAGEIQTVGKLKLKSVGDEVSISGGQRLKLECGASSIELSPNKITLKVAGTSLELSGAKMTGKAPIMKMEGSTKGEFKGGQNSNN